ncbi:hypothetical protein CVT26_012158 [Gymnopilus dilepis]|uniref:Lactate/malate dehydrogenase C-terminal domain-containing protein n=1 Tax=Gymnopilus dilepis TaxID=231916 RepID=A0A409W5P5_9AGAR|nr:hypothetical protein CVT26_012158 [Gymnopilus dilepis]
MFVPIVGGDLYIDRSPPFSIFPLPSSFCKDQYDALVKRVQSGGDEVVQATDRAGSAIPSMAYAGAEFSIKIIRAITQGLVKIYPVGKITEAELALVKVSTPESTKNILASGQKLGDPCHPQGPGYLGQSMMAIRSAGGILPGPPRTTDDHVLSSEEYLQDSVNLLPSAEMKWTSQLRSLDI